MPFMRFMVNFIWFWFSQVRAFQGKLQKNSCRLSAFGFSASRSLELVGTGGNLWREVLEFPPVPLSSPGFHPRCCPIVARIMLEYLAANKEWIVVGIGVVILKKARVAPCFCLAAQLI